MTRHESHGWGAMRRLREGNIAVGNFFFRYRNTIFPTLFVLIALLGRPRVILGHPALDRWLVACGTLVALAGQCVRLVTIGYEYIERGGKAGKVYASHLVQGGVYALTRNPMYLGNGLIAIGMTMVAGAPLLYVVVLPFFLFVYQALIAAEEAYLQVTFGAEYARYCALVNRLLPAFGRIRQTLGGLRYDWRSAVRQELSTLAGLLTGLTLLPVWRTYFLEGFDAAKVKAPTALIVELLVLFLYGLLIALKKRRRLFYPPTDVPG